MELKIVPPDLRRLDETSAEIVACGVWEDRWPMRGLAGLLDWRLAGRLSELAKAGFLKGEHGEALLVPGRPRVPYEKVLLLGLGPRSGFGDGTCREAIRRLLDALTGLKIRRAVVEIPGRCDGTLEPARAAELVAELVMGSEDQDAWWVVDSEDAAKAITRLAQEDRRRSRRG